MKVQERFIKRQRGDRDAHGDCKDCGRKEMDEVRMVDGDVAVEERIVLQVAGRTEC